MGITKEQVAKALGDLELDETVSKGNGDGTLNDPEGAAAESDEKKLGAKKEGMKKMSDAASADAGKEGYKSEFPANYEDTLPEEVETKVDVSDFLKSLVSHTGSSIDALRDYVAKSEMAHQDRYEDLMETVDGIQQSQQKIGIVLKAVCERIGVLGSEPAAAPKSTTVAKSEGAATERNFEQASAEVVQPKQEGNFLFKGLSDDPNTAKSQITGALMDMVRKSEEGVTEMDVIGFESQGFVRPELASKLKSKFE